MYGTDRSDNMVYPRPSDYGPTFLFEIPLQIIIRERFEKAFVNAFEPYITDFKNRPELRERAWNLYEKYGNTDITLAQKVFNYQGDNTLAIRLVRLPYNINIQYLREFYQFIPNEKDYNYFAIKIFREEKTQTFLSTDEKRFAFHNILKEWIKELTPHYVWGDLFTTLKKEGSVDSRLNVWGYNYYSQSLMEAIGMDKFNVLIKSGNDWVIEEFNNGLILTGSPDPYSKKKAPRNKAKKILRLDECLKGIINIKPTRHISTKEIH